MNRRRHTRQPISLSALLHPENGRSWLCTVRDFCQQGMLLTGTGASRSLAATGADPASGDIVAIHFSVPTPKGHEHFRTQATIARILENGNGIGVVFEQGLPEDAFNALLEFAVASGMLSRSAAIAVGGKDDDEVESSSDAGQENLDSRRDDSRRGASGEEIPDTLLRDRSISKEQSLQIRAKVRRVVERALTRLVREFTAKASEELLASARDAGTNAAQMMFFEGLDCLEKNQQELISAFVGEVLRQVDQVTELEEVLEKRRRREGADTPEARGRGYRRL